MLSALTLGTTPQGLRMIGRTSGLTDARIAEFEERIAPALAASVAEARAVVAVTGSGVTVNQLGWRLAEAELLPRLVGASPTVAVTSPPPSDIEFAVIVAHFVIAPEFFGSWLRNDIPHLPIVYGDTGVRIGPIIEPGLSPCLYCLERHHVDEDPAWPAMATQLLGRTSMAETAFVASEVAVRATRIIRNRLNTAAQTPAVSVTLDTGTGALSTREWNRHPECSCHDLSGRAGLSRQAGLSERQGASAPTPPESGTQRSRHRGGRRTATTTGAVAFAPW